MHAFIKVKSEGKRTLECKLLFARLKKLTKLNCLNIQTRRTSESDA